MNAPAARPRCKARPAGTDPRRACTAPARFEIGRYLDHPLPVCPEHLGPALLQAPNVLWPPGITLIG